MLTLEPTVQKYGLFWAKWGVSKNWGPLLGNLTNRTKVYWDLFLGPPVVGNPHMEPQGMPLKPSLKDRTLILIAEDFLCSGQQWSQSLGASCPLLIDVISPHWICGNTAAGVVCSCHSNMLRLAFMLYIIYVYVYVETATD